MSTIAPAGAGAFVGESSVLNPAKTDLTGPAKTILTKPTFITTSVGEAGGFGGAAEASGAARVFQLGKILPGLGGALLAFGVGAAVGTEICGVLGIEGCWNFSSVDADPATGVTNGQFWEWQGATATPPFVWKWSHGYRLYQGVEGTPSDCGAETPSGYTHVGGSPASAACSGGKTGTKVSLFRHSMANRTLTYSATDDPGVANYSYSAPGDWSEEMAQALQEGTPESDRVGERIASEIEGTGVKNPYVTTVTVPSCSGEAWIGCQELLDDLDLVPERSELTWEDAYLDLDADAVVETAPAGGSVVDVGTKVVVTTNPGEEGMPALVPAPLPGETYDAYIARLAPNLSPNRVTVAPEFTDPSSGPDGVIRTVPKSGTRINPETETDVDVHTNPTDAPPAAATWSAPPVSGLDLSPLGEVEIGCNDFPFGIFCWIGSGLTAWGPGGECPQLGVPFGSSVGLDSELAFDTCLFEPAMEVVRPVLILLSAFSLAYFFAAAAMGFGGSTGDD